MWHVTQNVCIFISLYLPQNNNQENQASVCVCHVCGLGCHVCGLGCSEKRKKVEKCNFLFHVFFLSLSSFFCIAKFFNTFPHRCLVLTRTSNYEACYGNKR
uniref:Uncharacterized protein n=1 Tax=Cacopsylla melanoneura TaxID=428564 RepID=A0A8D8ZN25_9HEMI